MNLKQMVMIGACAATVFIGTTAHAQWNTRRNVFGGYDIVTPGRTYTGMPNVFGGMDFRGGWSTQRNVFGGYNIITPDRTYTGIPNVFGGMDFRGKMDSAIFSNTQFCSMLDTLELAEAIQSNDAARIMGFAWDLKGAETILGKVDQKTTSKALFETAAKLAVEQGNSDVLKQIIELAPECKTFEAQLAMKTKTRGANKSVCALPQLCLLPPKDYKKAIDSLTMWQQPMFGDYICQSFRGMSKQSADTASMLVNEGRITMNPQMIAMGALELSKYPYNSELGIKFEPAQIFAEAVELAIVKQDKAALTQLAALYNTASFKSEECAKYIQSELAMLSGMRGMKPNAKCAPGDFGPVDFHKLIRTVYFEEPENQVK